MNQIPREVSVEAAYAYVSQVIHSSIKNEHSVKATIFKTWLLIFKMLILTEANLATKQFF